MQIKNEKPPVWDSACAAFNVNPKNTVFTYGDTIYNPSGKAVSDDVIAHEFIHAEQQGHDDEKAALWWGRYLREPQFRIDQEAWAYAAQYAFLCERFKDRNKRVRIIFDLARILSGPLYGSAIKFDDAAALIRGYAKV